VLDKVLGKLARQHDPNVLVGFDYADDAGVYRLDDSTALVQTVDFFTPIVDDPYIFGQIAATNSLSDVYAMGGRPITALALVCFPDKADVEILERILAGGLSKMVEAGCTVIGGHSIRDEETKFGYAVTGIMHPARVLKNGGAQVGDRLLLTKALGTGVISTAIKKGTAKQEWIDAAVRSMTTLNRAAADVIALFKPHQPGPRFQVHSLTDVTGFGLIGHAREMAVASEVSMMIHANAVKALPGALECIAAGNIPGGLKANRDFAECAVRYEEDTYHGDTETRRQNNSEVSEELKTLLFDPQTAGGLLISVAANDAGELISALRDAGVDAVEIGEVREKGDARIFVTP
jgi:selenide,water dikinase